MYADFTPYRVICRPCPLGRVPDRGWRRPWQRGTQLHHAHDHPPRRPASAPRSGCTNRSWPKVAEAVIAEYGDFYPELKKSSGAILDNLTREEIRFARTIESGTAHLENLLSELRASESDRPRRSPRLRPVCHLWACPSRSHAISPANRAWMWMKKVSRPRVRNTASPPAAAKPWARLGGEDAEFFAGILKDLQKKKKLGEHGVEYDPYTSPHRRRAKCLPSLSNGQSGRVCLLRRPGGSDPAEDWLLYRVRWSGG